MSENKTTKTCGECKNFVVSNYLDVCTVNGESMRYPNKITDCEYFEPKVITNGDKIRQMSDEELAFMLVPKVMFCDGCPVKCEEKDIPTLEECPFGTDNIENICVQRVIAWLKQEAKDE